MIFDLKEKYPSIQFEKVNVTDFDFKNNKVVTQFKKSEKFSLHNPKN